MVELLALGLMIMGLLLVVLGQVLDLRKAVDKLGKEVASLASVIE